MAGIFGHFVGACENRFAFLREPQSADAVFYRWRVWSLAQGDSLHRFDPISMAPYPNRHCPIILPEINTER